MPRKKFKRVTAKEAAQFYMDLAAGMSVNEIAIAEGRSWKTVDAAIKQHFSMLDRIPSLNGTTTTVTEVKSWPMVTLACFDCHVVETGSIERHATHDYIVVEGDNTDSVGIYRVVIDVHADSTMDLARALADEGDIVSITKVGRDN